jgi:hypothetical protein
MNPKLSAMLVAVVLCLSGSSCALLRTGWARVTWLDGGVVPESQCIAKIGAEGDVEMLCKAPSQSLPKPRRSVSPGEI